MRRPRLALWTGQNSLSRDVLCSLLSSANKIVKKLLLWDVIRRDLDLNLAAWWPRKYCWFILKASRRSRSNRFPVSIYLYSSQKNKQTDKQTNKHGYKYMPPKATPCQIKIIKLTEVNKAGLGRRWMLLEHVSYLQCMSQNVGWQLQSLYISTFMPFELILLIIKDSYTHYINLKSFYRWEVFILKINRPVTNYKIDLRNDFRNDFRYHQPWLRH